MFTNNKMNYTDPSLRERLKKAIMAGDRGGKSGQWSARKAQLLRREYEAAGGGYKGKKTEAQKSLTTWTKQDWTTKSGKPSLETGERYLPRKVIEKLTDKQYALTTAKKRKDLKAGIQYSKQPKLKN